MESTVKRAFHSVGVDISWNKPSLQTLGFEPAIVSTESIVDPSELETLQKEYRAHPLTALNKKSIWSQKGGSERPQLDIDSKNFRADNAYLYQARRGALENFLISSLWIDRSDSYDLLSRTSEDGCFGAECVRVDSRLYSRDLIDSVLEITFLMDNLPTGSLDRMRIIDIGAGYGRLLHRLADVTSNPQLFGADGVPLSTAICRAYLRHRKLQSRTTVLSLGELSDLEGTFDLAANIHSFSEMSYAAVAWWLDWLVARDVKYLFIVPNHPGPALNDGTTFMPLLAERHFDLLCHRLKYRDRLVGEHAIYPAEYYLFGRTTG